MSRSRDAALGYGNAEGANWCSPAVHSGHSSPQASEERQLPVLSWWKRNPRRKARMYKCARCQEPILTSLNTVGIQCKKCGSKVFYKERPNVKKIVRAR